MGCQLVFLVFLGKSFITQCARDRFVVKSINMSCEIKVEVKQSITQCAGEGFILLWTSSMLLVILHLDVINLLQNRQDKDLL